MNNTSASPAYNDDSDCSSRQDGETERQKEKDELQATISGIPLVERLSATLKKKKFGGSSMTFGKSFIAQVLSPEAQFNVSGCFEVSNI